MAKLYYIRGKAGKSSVPSARGYTLAQKLSDGTYKELETKMTRQGFPFAGSISGDGAHVSPSEIFTTVGVGESSSTTVTPVAKFTTEGPKYYIKVKGKMNVESYEGYSSGVEFSGIGYVNDPEAFEFYYTGLGYDAETKKVYLDGKKRVKVGEENVDTDITIPVFDLSGTTVISVGLADSVTVFHADLKYRRTDFIEIDALTDDLYDESNRRVCVKTFAPVGNETPIYKLAFYSEMDYTKCVKTMTYEQLKTFFGATTKPSLTAAEVKDISTRLPTGTPEAKYVIFTSSKPTSGDDEVSVGIYFPLYGQYAALLEGEPPYELAVKAEGNDITFKDSDYSTVDQIFYTPEA